MEKQMKTITLLVELEYDIASMHGDDDEGHAWFYGEIMRDPGLSLFSEEIGDTVGSIKVIGEMRKL